MDSKAKGPKGRLATGLVIAFVLFGFFVKVTSDYDLIDKIRYGPNALIITAKNVRFKPENPTVIASIGDTVHIALRNRDYEWKHDLVIPGLELVTTVIKGGEKAVLEFRLMRYGSFEFYCTRHQISMKGIIRFEKPGI